MKNRGYIAAATCLALTGCGNHSQGSSEAKVSTESEWHMVSVSEFEGEMQIYYMDYKSISDNSGKKKAWSEGIYSHTDPYGNNGTMILSEYNCAEKTHHPLVGISILENGKRGSSADLSSKPWTTPAPDTPGSRFLDIACSSDHPQWKAALDNDPYRDANDRYQRNDFT